MIGLPREVAYYYTLRYVECDLAPKNVETKPVAQIFLSNQFQRSKETGGMHNIHLDEDNLKREYKGVLKGVLDPKYEDGVPAMAGIGIHSYAVHRNDFGHACYVNVGTAHVFAGAIEAAMQKQGYYDHTHDLVMHTTVVTGNAPVKKGVVELTIDKVEYGAGLSSAQNGGGRVGKIQDCLLSAPIDLIEAQLNTYIQTCMAVETSMQDILPGTERVRAPMDISEVGAEFTGNAFLPVVAFSMMETPVANADFFINAFEVVMDRRRLKPSDYVDFDEKEKCRTLAQIISNAVQSFDYIGDAVELSNRRDRNNLQRQHVGSEEFSSPWAQLTDDCEDSCNGIAAVGKALDKVNFDPNNPKHRPLLEMQKLYREHYISMMTLSIVHGAKIGDQEGFGAHMYDLVMPKFYFEHGLSQCASGRQLLERMRPIADAPDTLENLIAIGLATNETDVRELRPVLVCEGTGIVDPIGFTDPLYEQYKYVSMNLQSFSHFKKRIPREEYAPSPFYMANYFGISSDLIDKYGINVGGFVFGTRELSSESSHTGDEDSSSIKRGALFTDTITCNPNLAIIPHPPVPPTIMQLIREALAFNEPARPLVIDRTKPLAGPEKHPLWDELVNAVAGMKRKQGVKARGSVDHIIRPHQFDRNTIRSMIHEIAQHDRVWAVEYKKEQMLTNVYNWRVMLYVH
jgi:hypothetical protein